MPTKGQNSLNTTRPHQEKESMGRICLVLCITLTRLDTRHDGQDMDTCPRTEDISLGSRLLVRNRSDEDSILRDGLRGVVLNWNRLKIILLQICSSPVRTCRTRQLPTQIHHRQMPRRRWRLDTCCKTLLNPNKARWSTDLWNWQSRFLLYPSQMFT